MLLKKYTLLITLFVTGKITAHQFEMLYLNMFKGESGLLSEKDYGVLNELFHDVDAYCSDPDLRGEDDLDDQGLLERANVALTKIL